MTLEKKLIEVALPLDAINAASAREKSIRHGHPSTLHLWWARRPLAAARAVIFSQMVDDPSTYVDVLLSDPELKSAAKRELKKRIAERAAKEELSGEKPAEPEPTLEEVIADIERQRLFAIIEDLVKWENTTNETVLQRARDEIWQSWRRACAENAGHPRAKELFDREKLPAFHDPFAGGGALPLEAQRLGLEAHASDLNPVAVLINKAMIEIPPRFAGRPPVNPGVRSQELGVSERWGDGSALSGAGRLAEGDGPCEGGVSTGGASSPGGDVRDAVADHSCGDLGAGEHRGGVDTGVQEGEGTVPGDRAGVPGGDRDVPEPVRGDRLVSTGKDASSAQPGQRGGQDLEHTPQKTETPPLTPTSYLLTPISDWRGARGLASDVRYYGKWMRDEAQKRIGHLYPKIEVTEEMAKERPDLEKYAGQELTVIAWLWARTVKSPNPAFADVDVPLASTFMLSTKKGKEAYVEPVVDGSGYRFTVKAGTPKDPEAAKAGTKLGRGANFRCLMSGTPMNGDHIKAEGKAGRMSARLMAIVAEGDRGRVYLAPTPEHEAAAREAQPAWKPETPLPDDPRNFWTVQYGLTTFGDLFTSRQLVALTTFSDLVAEAMDRVRHDASAAGLPDDDKPLRDGGAGAGAYGEAVSAYLTCVLSKLTNIGSSIASWMSDRGAFRETFARQAIPMVWDYAESSPLADAGGSLAAALDKGAMVLDSLPATIAGAASALQLDATSQSTTSQNLVSTDPPYYDNIGYADLSDFFYVWLRRSLRPVFPELFATVAVPKTEELVATPHRHGGKKQAEAFFMEGMTQAMQRLATQAHPDFPVTIYYAFKQSEKRGDQGTASTGWETFLDAVIRAGFGISGTWPVRTEGAGRIIAKGTNALASSIVLVCRPRAADAPTTSRRDFLTALKAELPAALAHLQRSNIAPVDLAQAAIGPGMAVYTRYAKVLESDGSPLGVRTALALINQVLDETLAEQEGDFDADTRWALAWFTQSGFDEGEYGVAETLSKAKNTSVSGLVEAGILKSKGGKVRLLAPADLPEDWDPESDPRLTVWEMVHHLIRTLESGGESAAGDLAAKLGAKADAARELAYRLYSLCERKKRANLALAYNALVQSWPEIARLAQEAGRPRERQTDFLGER